MRATWYFDFISPFAYLQLGRFRDLPSELEITLEPVLFSTLIRRIKTRSSVSIRGRPPRGRDFHRK